MKHKKCIKCDISFEDLGSNIAKYIFRVKPSKKKKGYLISMDNSLFNLFIYNILIVF